MVENLAPNEIRVIGALLEKEITTPDQYPLSLNGLTQACNQKSNREPVTDLDESTVQEVLDDLSKRNLVKGHAGFGSRVMKYQHRFCNTEFGDFKLNPRELGIVCVLFLRGPQTPGELRTRTQRLCDFRDVSEVENTLQEMQARRKALVKMLPREPGKRESRYIHLFSDDADSADTSSVESESQPAEKEEVESLLELRIAILEEELEKLKQRVEGLED